MCLCARTRGTKKMGKIWAVFHEKPGKSLGKKSFIWVSKQNDKFPEKKNKWDRHEVSQDDDATSTKVAWTPRFQQKRPLRQTWCTATSGSVTVNPTGLPMSWLVVEMVEPPWEKYSNQCQSCQCQSSSHSLSGLRWKPCTPSSAAPGVDDDTPLAASLLWNEIWQLRDASKKSLASPEDPWCWNIYLHWPLK